VSEAVKAYPLQWPAGWKRTPSGARRRASFGKVSFQAGSQPGTGWHSKGALSVADALNRILGELRRMAIDQQDVVISTNLRTRLDGLPRSDQKMPEDPGVAVYWVDRSGARRCMAIDHYDRVEHNLAAVAATLEAMRAIERHGGAAILDRAFTGFTALPPPVAAGKPWRYVLGFDEGEQPTEEQVRAEYRIARGDAHPDRPTGSHEEFLAVQAAYEQAARELGFRP
jgi:hypothetical protein